jgi:competence ComEA-like helix-hairpin-helix protein
VKASPSQSAAGLIVAALALVALASGRPPPKAVSMVRAAPNRASSAAVHALREGESLDLNRAALGDLLLLPGVGPKLAQRIIDERTRRGHYGRVEELLEVKGIGPATLVRLSRFVRVSAWSTDRAAATR